MVILSLFAVNTGESGMMDDSVTRLENDRTRQLILKKAKTALQSGIKDEQHRISIKARWIPGSLLNVPPQNILDVQPSGPVQRNTIFDVSYTYRSHRETAQIQLLVDSEYKIPVAASRIQAGEKLTAENLQLKWVSIPNNRGQLAFSIEEVEGKTVRRTLAPGQPVRMIDITTEYIIHAGDPVTVVYEANGIHIGLKAEARENGSMGDEIKIYSEETRKRYVGKVQSPQKVIWQKTL